MGEGEQEWRGHRVEMGGPARHADAAQGWVGSVTKIKSPGALLRGLVAPHRCVRRTAPTICYYPVGGWIRLAPPARADSNNPGCLRSWAMVLSCRLSRPPATVGPQNRFHGRLPFSASRQDIVPALRADYQYTAAGSRPARWSFRLGGWWRGMGWRWFSNQCAGI